MEELDFKKLSVSDTSYDLKEAYLTRESYKDIEKIIPVNWYLGKKSNRGFCKYTEDVSIDDTPRDSEEFRNSLDFNNSVEDASLEGLESKTRNIDISDYGDLGGNSFVEDNYEEGLACEVGRKFSKFLRDNKEDIVSLLEDPNGLEEDDLDDVEEIVSKDVINSENPEEELEDEDSLNEKFELYINNIYEAKKRRSNYIPVEALKETDLTKKSPKLGYIVRDSSGDWLSLDESGNYSFEDSLSLAELFDSEEEAEEVLGECMGRREARNCTIEPLYEKTKKVYQSLKETGSKDACLICEEFDRLFPEGNLHRTEYDLTRRLMSFGNLREEDAKKISKKFFN